MANKMIKALTDVLSNLVQVKKQTGKSVSSQLRELILLRILNDVGFTDYYDLRLWDDTRFTTREKFEYVGWRKEKKMDDIGNDPEYYGLVNDKFIFHELMTVFGIPSPEIYCIYNRSGRNYGRAKTISSLDHLHSFLLDRIRYPFFSKPNNAAGGIDAVGVADRDKNRLNLINGLVLDMDEYLKNLHGSGRDFLFQECLETTDYLKGVCGNHLTTLRIISIMENTKPKIHRIVWKFPLGENMTDNFHVGDVGNMVAHVERDTGKIIRMVMGAGLTQKMIDKHPETEEIIGNLQVPFFEDVRNIVLKGTSVFPWLKIQHWDIAITRRGPVVVENNIFGGTYLPQMAGPPGIWDEEFKSFISTIQKG